MGRRSKVHALPAEVKAWLDEALVAENFSRYRELADALRARGFEISKSSLQRYGEPFAAMMAKVKLAGEQAQALMAEAGDDKGAMNDALIRMVQQRTFELLMLDGDGALAGDPKFVRALAALVRASVTQKEWAQKVARTLDAAVDRAASDLAQGKDPADVLQAIRAAYTGALA